jgi:hypothetical protein
MTNINIYAGNENLFRVYEICLCGGHFAKLVPTDDTDNAPDSKQIKLLTAKLELVAIK